jgi:hypothetical protein
MFVVESGCTTFDHEFIIGMNSPAPFTALFEKDYLLDRIFLKKSIR